MQDDKSNVNDTPIVEENLTVKNKISKNKPKKRKPKKKATARISKPTRNFPIITVEKCLIVAQKIKEINGGNPWTPREVARAVNIGDTQKLFYYTAASRDFGFTTASSSSKEIALTEFGRETVYAPNAEIEKRKKIEAFLKVEIFKNVLDYYKTSVLPEMKYLSNILEDKFKLNPIFHVEFSKVFNANCKELGITTGNPLDEIITESNISTQPPTVTLGETRKNIKNKLKAFVIIPFSEKYDKRPLGFFKEVLDSLIVPSGVEAGFDIETASRQGSDVIQSTIINDLLEADLVIADLTDHNPNVLFELGMRMHADKPIAIIKTNDTGKIFDIDNILRVYEYDQNLWKSTIETDKPNLIEHFKAAWENKGSEQTYLKILRRGASSTTDINK